MPANDESSSSGRKGKQKKLNSQEASRLLQARISQLEQDAADEKDQETEIEREVKKASRDLVQQITKMSDIQKIELLIRRSSDLLAEMRRVEKENQKNKKRGDTLQKEKDANRAELTKTVGLKEKLEKLCRELQRDNNKLKNENKTLQDTLKHNQSTWDERFHTVLSKLDGYQEEKDTPRKQVVDMEMEELFRVRFKSLIEQYELRELHFHSLMRTKELEVQYNMARYESQKKETETETAQNILLQSQVQTFTRTETELRSQLNVYVDKFKQVEDTLNNSNDLFLSFRKEMEDMSKKTKRLEKENDTLRRKHDATNANIIRMAEEREDLKKKSDAAEKKAEKLMAIIRNMQQQGRQAPAGVLAPSSALGPTGSGSSPSDVNGQADEVDTVDYSEEDEEDEEDDVDVEVSDVEDEDTEDETAVLEATERRPFGPERPPHNTAQPVVNGH